MEGLANVVEGVLQEESRLVEIIGLLERNDNRAFSLLSAFFPNEYEQKLFAWNTALLKGMTRADYERPYMSHPALAALLAMRIIGDEDPDKHMAIRKALTHDLFDEALGGDTNKLVELRRMHPEYRIEIDSSVMLATPLDWDWTQRDQKNAIPIQIARYGDRADAYAHLFEQMHNLHDQGHRVGKYNEHEAVARWSISRVLYIAEVFRDILPQDTLKLAKEEANSIARIRGVIQSSREFYGQNLEFRDRCSKEIFVLSKAYLERNGLSIAEKNKR